MTAKIDNIQILLSPAAGANPVATVTTTDPLVYLGEETNGFILVQGSGGKGWINKVLVAKQ